MDVKERIHGNLYDRFDVWGTELVSHNELISDVRRLIGQEAVYRNLRLVDAEVQMFIVRRYKSGGTFSAWPLEPRQNYIVFTWNADLYDELGWEIYRHTVLHEIAHAEAYLRGMDYHDGDEDFERLCREFGGYTRIDYVKALYQNDIYSDDEVYSLGDK